MKNEERKKREEILRQRAESLLSKKATRKSSQLSEADILKLIHELEVHQVELKLQNEELQQAKEAEKVAAEQKYLQLYDFAPTGYYTLSKQGDILELNLMGAKLLGKERSHLKNSRFAFFVSDDSKSIFNKFLETVILSNSQESCEISLSSPNELTIHLTGVASKMGKQCLVTAIDITERKRAEIAIRENDIQLKKYSEELEKLNKDKDFFIRVLAHDLRGPFNAMLGISDLLLKNLHKYDINKIEYQLRAKHQLIHKTYHLLDDLLLWSRSQFGMLDYNPQDVVVKDICDELISSVSECAKSKNISITFFESDYPTIKADQNMLKTILRNLLSNAIKFTHNNGQILIHTETSNNNFIFTVSDNGVGISKEDQLKLWDFSNYFSKPGTNNEQGTGLGLLICKRFVEAHGGKIWVESDPSSKTNGKGSDFKFSIPISS